MHKSDRGFTAGNVCEKHFWSYLIPASQPPLIVDTPEQERQIKQQPTELASNMYSLAPLSGDHNISNLYLCTCAQMSPFSLPEGMHAGKFLLRQKGRRRSPLEITPLSSLRRSVEVNQVSRLWGLRGWILTSSAWTRKLEFVYIGLIPLLQNSFGSAGIHRNVCPFTSLETALLGAKMPFVGPSLPHFEYPEHAQTQLCWLAPREILPSHLISTEHSSQPLQFNYYPLAFDFLTRVYGATEINILFFNIMS